MQERKNLALTAILISLVSPAFSQSYSSVMGGYTYTATSYEFGFGEAYKTEESVHLVSADACYSNLFLEGSNGEAGITMGLGMKVAVKGTHKTTDKANGGFTVENGELPIHKIPLEFNIGLGVEASTPVDRRASVGIRILPVLSYVLYNEAQPSQEVMFGIPISFSVKIQRNFTDIVFGQAGPDNHLYTIQEGFKRISVSPSIGLAFGVQKEKRK